LSNSAVIEAAFKKLRKWNSIDRNSSTWVRMLDVDPSAARGNKASRRCDSCLKSRVCFAPFRTSCGEKGEDQSHWTQCGRSSQEFCVAFKNRCIVWSDTSINRKTNAMCSLRIQAQIFDLSEFYTLRHLSRTKIGFKLGGQINFEQRISFSKSKSDRHWGVIHSPREFRECVRMFDVLEAAWRWVRMWPVDMKVWFLLSHFWIVRCRPHSHTFPWWNDSTGFKKQYRQ
jgi:hypothetical protein